MNPNIDFIPFSRPEIGQEEEAAVLRVLRSGWLTTGPETNQFEQEFAAYVEAPYALAVNSATAGLHLSLEALGIKPGDRVLTTPYTFTATAEVIRYLGAEPVFVDIDEQTYNLDPYLLERELEKARRKPGKKPAAILPVHIAGLPCDMDHIGNLAAEYGIPLVEDAAHTFPVKYHGVAYSKRFAGTAGACGVYSFYANKTMTTGEGGMVVTGRADLAQRIRIMRLHGIDRECWDRYQSARAGWEYMVVEPGFKYNMTDIAAALGRVQLKKAGQFLEQRKEIAETYLKELADCDFLTLPLQSGASSTVADSSLENLKNFENHAWHLFLVRLNIDKLTIDRDEFILRLKQAGIGTSVHYRPLHMMPYYEERYGLQPEDFPVALSNFKRSISLPIYPSLKAEQLQHIIETIKQIGYTHHRPALQATGCAV